MRKADKEMLRINNKLLILQELKKWDLSRIELAGITGLSNSTVSSLVRELTAENLVFEESVAASTGGRKPIIFSLNTSAVYVLTLKLLAHRIEAAILNLKLQTIRKQCCAYTDCNESVLKNAIETVLDGILEDFPESEKRKLVGIGVSVPGLIDYANSMILYSSHLNIANFNIKQYLQTIINLNVYLYKDVDALMLGTYAQDNLRQNASYLYFYVGFGVGLSFLSNGKILQLNRSGMEIGHVQLIPGGPLCNCGKYGCVETFVSEYAAQKRYMELSETENGVKAPPSFDEMVFKSNRGDQKCRQILSEQCEYLGRAIALAVNIFAPNEVLIGGPLSEIKWNADEIIRRHVSENVLSNFAAVSLKFTNTPEEADFIGMANTIISHEFFEAEAFAF